MKKSQQWIDELENNLSTINIFNFQIVVYKDNIDHSWHMSCEQLSWEHRSLPKNIDSLSSAKIEALLRTKERLLFLYSEVVFLLEDS